MRFISYFNVWRETILDVASHCTSTEWKIVSDFAITSAYSTNSFCNQLESLSYTD